MHTARLMTKVFVGGSRNVSRLTAPVRSRLDRIVDKQFPILIGDANGADKAIQTYLRSKGYSQVEVFCAGQECRNNQGNWPVRAVLGHERNRTFDFYASKDRLMAHEASVGFMIWDGKSKGTLLNVLRLLQAGKSVAVYIGPSKAFLDLKSMADWERRMPVSNDLRERAEQQAASESHRASGQAPLFSDGWGATHDYQADEGSAAVNHRGRRSV
jgi:hypothetical protein